MSNEPTKQELEILAYIDGHLDESAARDLEERLRTSPELANRVHAYKAQSEALSLAYDASLTEPVPARLLAALEVRTPHRARTFTSVAALVCAIAAASILGWLAGRSYQPADELTYDFVERSFNEYAGTGVEPDFFSHDVEKAANVIPDTVSVSLTIPSLSHLGYRLVDKQTITGGSKTMVRLNYATPDNGSFSLFLHPRRDYAADGVELKMERSVSIAYWVVGPLAAAVAAQLPPNETLAIARKIRNVLSNPGALSPAIQTTSPKQRDLVTGLPVQDAQRTHNPLPNPITAPQVPNAIPN